MRLYLTRPSLEDENEIWNLIDEYNQCETEVEGIDEFEGIREISHIVNFEEWIMKMDRIRHKENIPSHLVPSTFYLAKDKINGKVIGGITIRHCLNDVLFKYGGHIAYSIRPTERKKGYGSEILKLGLNEYKNMRVDKVLVTCKKGNVGSSKVILNNGGVLENEVWVKERDNTFLRYWLNTEEEK